MRGRLVKNAENIEKREARRLVKSMSNFLLEGVVRRSRPKRSETKMENKRMLMITGFIRRREQ